MAKKKKKTPPEVFERQTQNILRLRRLLERDLGEDERSPTRRSVRRSEQTD